ncbi:MAG: glycosyltransferase family 9 protein [Desulfobacula sp.]|uniref:glycosyltransferase family 9 protein n=1 Tax=Desulfobacula sp. TaxID=2593537 RepID=UPI0025C0FF6E|nr:glycosyltransferase family 9 protein [Desulfobacula sp.]MCD4718367.1 glycosyltransferase family 9 protein [Desulfobacula sp.]
MMSTIKTIKRIDQIIGPVLLKLFPKAVMAKSKTISLKKILIIRPGGMGDALLLLPILKEISSSFHVRIDILCEPRNESIFKSVTFLNQVFSYKNFKSMLYVFQKHYDAVFDTEQSHFLSAIIARLVRADTKVGFKTKGREKMYNKAIAYSHHIYEAKMFWELFSTVFSLGKPFHFNFPYFIPPRHNQSLSFKEEKVICLFPGATIDERLWPEKRWANVIDWIANKNLLPILIGGSKEYNQCKKIMGYCKTDTGINLCSSLSILDTATLFNQTKLLISTDSGILHLGVLCNVPTISLFGAGIADKWAPQGKQHFVINKMLPCGPCTLYGTTPKCQRNKQCMMQIKSIDVIVAIKKIIMENV